MTVIVCGPVHEEILQNNLIAFHSLHFTDLHNLSAAVFKTALLNDQLDGAGYLPPDNADGQVQPGHEGQSLQARNAVSRRVGMYRRERAVVPGIHCLQHIQRLTRPAEQRDGEGVNGRPGV